MEQLRRLTTVNLPWLKVDNNQLEIAEEQTLK
jgi:hypothetical protein